jgi:adenosylmethionine-8-amino-7-oxononanoate aminotransferase
MTRPAVTQPVTQPVSASRVVNPDLRRDYPLAVRASGSYVYDEHGTAYLDGCSGAIVVNLGHGNPEILRAIGDQLERITFSYRTHFSNPPAEALAAELAEVAPGDLNHVLFTNSGSEAVEAAVRLALQYWRERGEPRRDVLVSRDGSYHGATLGSLGLSGHASRRRGLESVLPQWPRAAEANCHVCPFGLTRSSCALDCAGSIGAAIAAAGPDRVAAVVVEPVVGAAGGAVPSPPGYLRAVAEICRRYGVLLIADEVITGGGRTGRWFGCDEDGVVPDLIVLGKGVSAGYAPLGAVLVSSRVHDEIRAGTGLVGLGHTYAGNPLSTAAGLAVLRYARRHDLPARAARVGADLRRRLRQVLDGRGLTADVRGRGLLLAVDFTPGGQDDPGADSGIAAAALVAAAQRRGLLLYPAGTGAVQRAVIVAPPLTVTPGEVDELVRLFAAALDDVGNQPARGGAGTTKGVHR